MKWLSGKKMAQVSRQLWMRCFSECPEKLSWGRKPEKVQAFSAPISPGWAWSPSSFSGSEGTRLSREQMGGITSPHGLWIGLPPGGGIVPESYYEISFALHESIQEFWENQIWKTKNGKIGLSFGATQLNQVCSEIALTWQVMGRVILHFCDGEVF